MDMKKKRENQYGGREPIGIRESLASTLGRARIKGYLHLGSGGAKNLALPQKGERKYRPEDQGVVGLVVGYRLPADTVVGTLKDRTESCNLYPEKE